MSAHTDDRKGRVKQAVGDLTDNRDLHREGRNDRAGAKVKKAGEGLSNKVSDVVDAIKSKLHR